MSNDDAEQRWGWHKGYIAQGIKDGESYLEQGDLGRAAQRFLDAAQYCMGPSGRGFNATKHELPYFSQTEIAQYTLRAGWLFLAAGRPYQAELVAMIVIENREAIAYHPDARMLIRAAWKAQGFSARGDRSLSDALRETRLVAKRVRIAHEQKKEQ